MPPPPGSALTLANFLSRSPRRATSCKPHMHDDVFPLPPTKSPSLAFNLVLGRRLCWAKCAAHTLPPIGRASAYCCLLRQPNRASAKHTSDFVAKNIKMRRSLRTPPFHFHHPPSPGAPLNCVQRVRSRSREDIEGGGLGDSR
jgi:hypothetical protein